MLLYHQPGGLYARPVRFLYLPSAGSRIWRGGALKGGPLPSVKIFPRADPRAVRQSSRACACARALSWAKILSSDFQAKRKSETVRKSDFAFLISRRGRCSFRAGAGQNVTKRKKYFSQYKTDLRSSVPLTMARPLWQYLFKLPRVWHYGRYEGGGCLRFPNSSAEGNCERAFLNAFWVLWISFSRRSRDAQKANTCSRVSGK